MDDTIYDDTLGGVLFLLWSAYIYSECCAVKMRVFFAGSELRVHLILHHHHVLPPWLVRFLAQKSALQVYMRRPADWREKIALTSRNENDLVSFFLISLQEPKQTIRVGQCAAPRVFSMLVSEVL